MEMAPDAVESSARRYAWAANNPLVRAIARVPWPLGAKLIAGFGVIAALLGVGYALGFVSLRQANARSEQLRVLQQRTAYEQLLLTDATLYQADVDYLYHASGASQSFASAFGVAIARAGVKLCLDAGCPNALGGSTRKGVTLFKTDPALARQIQSGPGGAISTVPNIRAEHRFSAVIVSKLTALARRTQAQARALVAQNHSSYTSSRNLLIGVGAGTLALVLGLGLLLSSSVVVPLRRTRERLAGIAVGDFSSEVEVPNRDELGGLAADVNRMNDELKRLYGELETASRHKSDFLATMSHELRTPLNAIIGFSEVLQEQMFGELNERQLGYVDDVLEAGKHLLSLINDVLDLAKIEAGRMELELSQVALPELLRGAVSMQSERASRGGIELALQTEPDEINVTADERRVRQVVFNLLSNAIKFTPAEGRVDISARVEDGRVEVAVADTGPGIAAGDLEKIFEEFEQADGGKQAEGTGLGLPLSRKLVELHGGRLWAESTPGHGSTFRFTLPTEKDA